MPLVDWECRDHYTVEIAQQYDKQGKYELYGKYTLYIDLGENVKIFIRYKNKNKDSQPLTMEIGRITPRGCFRRTPKPKEALESWKKRGTTGHCITYHEWQRQTDTHELFIDLETEVKIVIRHYTGNRSWGYWPEIASYTEIGTITERGTWEKKKKERLNEQEKKSFKSD